MSLLEAVLLTWLVGLPALILVGAFALSVIDRRRDALRLAVMARPASCVGWRRRPGAGITSRMNARRVGAPHSR
jgi:hypothetical protein